MTDVATYVTITGPSEFELRQCAVPVVPSDAALVEVEACGVCGSDVELFAGGGPVRFPIVPGHEPVGRISKIGREAAAMWGLEEGDRVALLSIMRCGRCRNCRNAGPCLAGAGLPVYAYGFLNADRIPPLSGGFATHLFLSSHAQFVPVPNDMPTGVASLYNAMANGIEWTLNAGGVRMGDRVLIIGPGPRGLACAVAARMAGATEILVLGLAADTERLQFASDLAGARSLQIAADASAAEICQQVGIWDLVIDTTPGSVAASELAVELAAVQARIVFAGMKHGKAMALPVDDVIRRQLTIASGYSKSQASTSTAISILSRPDMPFERWASHAFPLAAFDEAISAVGGTVEGRRPLHVRIEPALG